jgi:hypothetical protein
MGCFISSSAPPAAPVSPPPAASDVIHTVVVDTVPASSPDREQPPKPEAKVVEPLSSPVLEPTATQEPTPNHQPSFVWADNENLIQETKMDAPAAAAVEKPVSKLTYSSMGLVGAEKIIGFLSACALDDVEDVEAFLSGDTWIESRDKVPNNALLNCFFWLATPQ